MRHLGILATTPEGAALCFRVFCQQGLDERGQRDRPAVTLDCIALARSLPAWERADHQSVRATLSVSVQRLARAGADFFACPDNTAHVALEQPGPDLALPGLHIAEVVADQAARNGHARVGLLGTKYTMDGPAGSSAPSIPPPRCCRRMASIRSGCGPSLTARSDRPGPAGRDRPSQSNVFACLTSSSSTVASWP
jgi:Asp/Glu/hydantoin racemase